MASPSSHNNKENPVNSLAKYAGLGTQIIAGLLISLYLGKKWTLTLLGITELPGFYLHFSFYLRW
jgi:hypothetical protein